MMIKKIKILGYGKLSDVEMNFKNGLNIVYGPNESGKSTIRSFIFGMLYGGIAANSKRTIYTEEYNSQLPWSGLNYEGSMEIERNNEYYHIYRNFQKGNERLSIINIKTGEDAKNKFMIDQSKRVERIDYEFFGVSESTIRKNFVIDPLYNDFNMGVSIDIRDRLNNKISTNDDNLSLEKLLNNIDSTNDIKGIKRTIKFLNNDIKELEDKLRYSNSKLEHTIDFDYLDDLSRKIEDLEKEYELKLNEKIIKITEYNQNDLAEQELIQEHQFLLYRREQLSLGAVDIDAVSSLLKHKNILSNEIEILEIKNGRSNYFHIALLIMSILGSTVSYFLVKDLFYQTLLAVMLSLILLMYKNNKSKRDAKSLSEKYQELDSIQEALVYAGVDVDTVDEEVLKRNTNEMNSIGTRLQEIEDVLGDKVYNNMETEQSDIDNEIVELKDKIDFAKIERARLLERIKINDESYKSELEDREELGLLNDELKEAESKYNLIEESKEILKKLSKEKFINHAEILSEKSSNYLEFLTDGKYKNIIVNPEGNILIKDLEAGEFVNVSNLSKGTIDQVYLAHRLSIIENLGLDFPLFIDDGLVLYDDERNFKALSLIAEISENRQVFLFTSHARDIKNIEKLGSKYNFIKLGA